MIDSMRRIVCWEVRQPGSDSPSDSQWKKALSRRPWVHRLASCSRFFRTQVSLRSPCPPGPFEWRPETPDLWCRPRSRLESS